jgi:hypothetical protein
MPLSYSSPPSPSPPEKTVKKQSPFIVFYIPTLGHVRLETFPGLNLAGYAGD